MCYPLIGRQSGVTVTVPALNGGINLNDDLTTVNDNQLTAGNNVWWYRNALRTRPGMVKEQEGNLSTKFLTCTSVNERQAMLGQVFGADDGSTGTFRGYAMDLDTGLSYMGYREGVQLGENGAFSCLGVKAAKESEVDYYFFLSDGQMLKKVPDITIRQYFHTDGETEVFPIGMTTVDEDMWFAYSVTFRNLLTDKDETYTRESDDMTEGKRYAPAVFGLTDDACAWVKIGAQLRYVDGSSAEGNRTFDAIRILLVLYDENGQQLERMPMPAHPSPYRDNLWVEVKEKNLQDAEPYVPLVLVNGKGVNTREELDTAGAAGNVYEGFNLLSPKFRCTYTTNGEAMYFPLPTVEGFDMDNFAYTYTFKNAMSGEVEVYESGTAGTSASVQYDPRVFGYTSTEYAYARPGMKMGMELTGGGTRWIAAYAVILLYDSAGDIVDQKPLPAFTKNNNLEFVLTADNRDEKSVICKMTHCTWFGGDRSGVGGGTRLFVTGNPDEPNLVRWSDVNNPLYFPENNYAYIGDGAEAVTGFGKQGDILVIFKEHEIYYAQYVAGDDADYEFAQSGGVEITTYMAKFPITPLHSTIGCDCPDSIRLVNNRLVWADSTGRVYMLPTVNQYNERNVREISPNIRPLLRQHSKGSLQNAVAGEFNGYYTLLVDNKLYLLDTQNSAFVSFNYYSKENDAQRALPWYVWTLDPMLTESERGRWVTMVSDGDYIRLLRQPEHVGVYGEQAWCLYSVEGDTDEGEPIDCSFTTKLFDFGRKDVRKAIMQLYIGLADTPESSVRVSYITDEYTAEDAYTLEAFGDHAEGEPGHMRTHRLTPGVRRVRQFGIRCDSEGAMAVDGIQIKMKPQGVVR